MKKSTLLVVVFSFCLSFSLSSQNKKSNPLIPSNGQSHEQCGTMKAIEDYLIQHPEAIKKQEENIKNMIQYQDTKNIQSFKTTAIITIPVVFHIVYNVNNAVENIPDYRISQQIVRLNEDYSKTNFDLSNVPAPFQSLVGDCQINFCLATLDPNGQPTTGITRNSTTSTGFTTDDKIKHVSSGGADSWDETKYLNIWVGNLSNGLLGYAKPPGLANPNEDGVVINYAATGITSGAYDLGRTATHEVGHYFSLLHIWGTSSPSCSDSDNINDTPNQYGVSSGCPTFPQTDNCTTSSPGIMFMNYMDYANDACANMFTIDQASVILGVLNGSRSYLKTSTKCGTGPQAPVADFTANNTTIFAGQTVDFTDQSTFVPNTWSWTFQNGTPSASTVENPKGVVFNTPGSYQVCLTVSNATTSNQKCKTGYINVNTVSNGCDTASNYLSNYTYNTYKAVGSSSTWGYYMGTNSFNDKAKAEYFNVAPAGGKPIVGALVYFKVAKGGNITASVDLKIWDNTGAAGSPGAIKASKTILINTITKDTWFPITLTTPLVITTPYYAGIQWKSNGAPQDTIAIAQSLKNEASVSTSWELWSTNAWHSFESSWQFKSAMAAKTIICASGLGTNESLLDLNTSIYPNPTKGELRVEIPMLQYNDLTVSVTDVLGSVLMSTTQNNILYGEFNFDLSKCTNGIYFVTVKSNNEFVAKRVVLNR